MGIEVKAVTSARREDVIVLYKEAGWWEQSDEEGTDWVDGIVSDSALFVGAFDGEKLIGMGRALSDSISDAYIQDIVVLKAYRGQGMGRKIIQTLIAGLKERGVEWIGLVAVPGSRSFYEDLGFRELKGHIPFKLED